MLADVGVRFSAEGIDAAIQRFTSAGKAFLGLSRDADSTAVALRKAETHIGGSFGRITRHADMMHRGVAKSFGLMRSLTSGFLGGLAAQKLAGLGTGGHAADVEKRADYLRIFDADEKELKAYSKHVKELRKRVPGVDKSDYMDAMFQIRSLQGTNIEANTKAAESVINLAKTLSPTGTMNQAMEYARAMMSAYGIGKGPAEKQALLDKIMAQTQVALREKLVTGHDLQMSARQLAPLYASAGRSTAELLSDLATVGAVAGEQAGEVVRNIMSKQGEGYGKLRSALAKEALLSRYGVGAEHDLPEKAKAQFSKAAKHYEELAERRGAKMLATGQTQQYMQELGQIYDKLKVLARTRGFDLSKAVADAFGETGIKGLPILLEEWNKGDQAKLKDMLEQADPTGAAQKVEGSFKSLGAQTSIFEQRLGNLGTSFRKLYSPALAWIMDRWGGSIDRVTDSLDRLAEGSDQSTQRFIGNFEKGFARAFGREDLGIEKWITGMIDNLSRGEEGWASLGTQTGETLGKMVSGLNETGAAAKQLAASVDAIAAPFKAIGWVIEQLQRVGMWGGAKHYDLQKQLGGGLFDPKTNPYLDRSLMGAPGVAARLWRWFSGEPTESGLSLRSAQPPRPELSPPWGLTRPEMSMMPGLPPLRQAPSAGEPNIEITTKPEVHVYIDGHEVFNAMRDQAVRENSRFRRGFGDNALGMGMP